MQKQYNSQQSLITTPYLKNNHSLINFCKKFSIMSPAFQKLLVDTSYSLFFFFFYIFMAL